ncbi:hypothetical protein KoPa4_00096 [Pseudomonas phage vB_PpuM-KoPa-4]|uniref:ParB/Sulfiredoxin domain-containing protein n=1 Tax=Pseudomonas phage vB_PpuM-KoPa-4 TaxID=3132618 RepID=A0AAX4MYZ6_9CAUD
MQFEMAMVTPEMAQKFLADNAAFQRKIRVGVVRDLANAILRGEWELTHQAVAFDINGKLIDGQHRLNAIVRAGVAVPCVIARGVGAQSFKVIDIGVKRTMSDVLALGKREVAVVGSISRNIMGCRKLSSSQTLSVYDEYSDTIEKVLNASGRAKGVFNSAAAHAAVVLSAHKKPEQHGRILGLYSNLVGQNFEALPPVGHALLRLALDGKLSAIGEGQRVDLLYKLLYVFDESKSENNRIIMGQDFKAAITMKLRGEVSRLVGDLKA